MSQWQEYFIKFIDCYVKQLTQGKKEFFLSFCDVEEELLNGLDVSGISGYAVVIVDNHDYSEAVRLRNTMDISRIVLLSGEGIKHIDSLKDFNEYPILSENYDILWECLRKALNISINNSARDFLKIILDQSEISLSVWMEYLKSSSEIVRSVRKLQKKEGVNREDKPKRLPPAKLNHNLPILGMWRSRKNSYLNKGETGRILRASRHSVVESRLTKAIMNGLITKPEIEKPITDGLASGNIESMFAKVCYEDVKAFFKVSRNILSEGKRTADIENVVFDDSYQYYLKTHSEKSVADIEAEWIERRKQEGLETDTEQEWTKYKCTEDELEGFKEQYILLEEAVGSMNLNEILIHDIQLKLIALRNSFLERWEKVVQATPICLSTFCDNAADYTQKYLELLAFALNENKVRAALVGTTVIQRLQLLFCHVEAERIEMPFYHPICVIYYMYLRQAYRFAMGQQEGGDVLRNQIWLGMIQKAGMQFPIEHMSLDGKTYALDHATVWQSNRVIFKDMNLGSVYSALDFRMISRLILDYIRKYPFLTDIHIAVIDINSLNGIVQLVNRILQFSQLEWYNIGRVEFLILSAREEELKKEMSGLWDNIGTEELVRFRFARNGYWDGNQYTMDKITEESDIIIIADNSMLYRAPRMATYSNNGLKNRLKVIDLGEQAERYFMLHSVDIAVLWDSLQFAAENREEGYRIWKNREIDNGFLAKINDTVSRYPGKAVIVVSSNEHILAEIFRTKYIHAHQGGYSSRNITIIEFENSNERKQLVDNGELKIVYSLKEFYDIMLGIDDIQNFFAECLEDILLEFRYENGEYYCRCFYKGKEVDEAEEEWTALCAEWIRWQIKKLLSDGNVLGICFRDALRNFLLEQAGSLPAVLLIESLFVEGFAQALENFSLVPVKNTNLMAERGADSYMERDCMEALKLHEIIMFARNKAGIDEQTVSQFRERYEVRLLERLIKCDAKYDMLPLDDRDKLQKIYERI